MIQKNSVKVISKNLFKRGYFKVMVDKLIKRLKEPSIGQQQKEASKWCEEVAIDIDEFCNSMDSNLYKESKKFDEEMSESAAEKVRKLPVKMGGGGNVLLTYFLVRFLKPEITVETGVSMGYTSWAFLEAMHVNQKGKLFSSDFPYFRIESPEKYIGWVVPKELKINWSLFIKGDQVNLPEMMLKFNSIDFFHYDSDKSIAGRQRAWETVKPQLSNNHCIVFDDIGDNKHFKQEFYDKGVPCKVLKTHLGGYVGVFGTALSPYIK